LSLSLSLFFFFFFNFFFLSCVLIFLTPPTSQNTFLGHFLRQPGQTSPGQYLTSMKILFFSFSQFWEWQPHYQIPRMFPSTGSMSPNLFFFSSFGLTVTYCPGCNFFVLVIHCSFPVTSFNRNPWSAPVLRTLSRFGAVHPPLRWVRGTLLMVLVVWTFVLVRFFCVWVPLLPRSLLTPSCPKIVCCFSFPFPESTIFGFVVGFPFSLSAVSVKNVSAGFFAVSYRFVLSSFRKFSGNKQVHITFFGWSFP